MRKDKFFLLVCLGLAGLLSSCYYPRTYYSDAWDLTEGRKDSLDFKETHHYTENFNFLMVGDSLVLRDERPEAYDNGTATTDSVSVFRGDCLVVADIVIVPEDAEDSVWVKVARDQMTMGWVHESDLLDKVIPDDPISYFIHVFSDKHLIYFMTVLGVLLIIYFIRRMRSQRFHIVHFDDIGSSYPTLLCLTLSGAATLYASIQNFVPETWVEFYYHPTLNPFGLPFILGLFIASIWMIVILALASVEAVVSQFSLHDALLYLFALVGVCAGCYLFFSLTTLYYIGYPCLMLYAVWALRRYYFHARCKYACGACGAKLREKGRCPRCGAWNE